jgi:choline dehydrogenase-like flavoprotein
MVYIRGNRADYDEWAAQGCTGWGYDDLLQYFKRAEDNERGANDFHGSGGPLPVSDGRARSATCAAFLEAAEAFGLPANADFNGPPRTASAGTSSPSATGAAPARRSRTCTRRATGEISRC